jgi:hypothetical protein
MPLLLLSLFLLIAQLPLFAQTTGMSSTGQPSLPRYAYSQVWTGTDLIVWGGANGLRWERRILGSGASYRPSANRWTALPARGAPAARYGHSTVWTGQEMIVWGGLLANGLPSGTGARYNPKTRQWRPVSAEGAPAPRSGHTAVWTGRVMIVWGGESQADGAAYDPARDQWTPISPVGAPAPRTGHGAVWTGRFMAIWGGRENGSQDERGSGGLYDPKTDKWTTISKSGAPWRGDGYTQLDGEKSVELLWTGSRLIAFPLSPGGASFRWWQTGGAYDLNTRRWTRIEATGAPSGRPYGLVWTGRRLVALGSSSNMMHASYYDFSSKNWRLISSASTGSFQGRQFSWARQFSEILVFGGLWTDGVGEFSGGSLGRRGFRVKLQPN